LGERGTLLWDGENRIEVERTDAPWDGRAFVEAVEKISLAAAPLEPARQGHSGNIGEFLDSVDARTFPQTAVADNLKSLAMVEAAIESAKRGEAVCLSQLEGS
jgi:predicted dehydrogenase